MSNPRERALLARLRRSGHGAALRAVTAECSKRGLSLYLVGGCVRDLMLGRPLADLDLVVEGDPRLVARGAARRLEGRAWGPSPFETWRVEGPGGLKLDLAMARRESYPAPAALPEVAPAPIAEDLTRRDFTVNAMALGLAGGRRGRLLDPSGGAADLRRRRLKLLHIRSLEDDPTRAFRAARYAARYSFRVGRQWSRAMSAAVRRGAFRRLGAARLRRELELAWKEERPQEVLSRAARLGLLERIDPAMEWSAGLRRAMARAAQLREEADGASPELFLAILLRTARPRARPRILDRLGITGRPAGRIGRAWEAPERAGRLLAGGSRRRPEELMEELGEWDRLCLRSALAASPKAIARRVQRLSEDWEEARPKLSGESLLEMGVPAGPQVGAVLRRIRRARAAGRVRTLRDEKELVRSLLASSRP